MPNFSWERHRKRQKRKMGDLSETDSNSMEIAGRMRNELSRPERVSGVHGTDISLPRNLDSRCLHESWRLCVKVCHIANCVPLCSGHADITWRKIINDFSCFFINEFQYLLLSNLSKTPIYKWAFQFDRKTKPKMNEIWKKENIKVLRILVPRLYHRGQRKFEGPL